MKRPMGVLLICGLLAFVFLLPGCSPGKAPGASGSKPAATPDWASRLKQTLNLGEIPYLKRLEFDRKMGLLMQCLSNLKNIGTALEMYNSDNGGLYPQSLDKLVPQYLNPLPESRSSKGTVRYEYRTEKGGKGYVLICKGDNYSDLNIPADYPRFGYKEQAIELQPGSFYKPRRLVINEEEASKLFTEGLKDLALIMESRDPKKARAAREKIQEALDSGKLPPDLQEYAPKIIESYRRIEGK